MAWRLRQLMNARVCREKNIVSSYQPNQIYLKLFCTAQLNLDKFAPCLAWPGAFAPRRWMPPMVQRRSKTCPPLGAAMSLCFFELQTERRPKKRHRLLELVCVTWSEATRRL